jgi:hypothetical protein
MVSVDKELYMLACATRDDLGKGPTDVTGFGLPPHWD